MYTIMLEDWTIWGHQRPLKKLEDIFYGNRFMYCLMVPMPHEQQFSTLAVDKFVLIGKNVTKKTHFDHTNI